GVRRDGRHGSRDGTRVRRRSRHTRLRLLDARGGDELHRLRDLFRRLGRLDLLPIDPKLRSHVSPVSLGVDRGRRSPQRRLLTIFSWLTSSTAIASNSSRPTDASGLPSPVWNSSLNLSTSVSSVATVSSDSTLLSRSVDSTSVLRPR